MSRVLRFSAVQDPAQVEWIAGILRQQILNGDLQPGDRVCREAIAKTYSVSAPVVKAAKRVLADEGLMQIDLDEAASVRELTEDDIAEIFAMRRMLEVAALHATRGAPREDFHIMEMTAGAMRRSAYDNDFATLVESDLLFHRLLLRFLGNSRLGNFYWKNVSELRPMLVVLDRSPGCDFESMIAEHELLLEDLLAGDIQPASERLVRHLNETEKRLQIMLLMKHVPPRQRHSR